jgi:LacI family transcriptional regulator
MATIYEVAKEAGVSPATVSRALNGIPVREDLVERVLAASQLLGYSPNRTARDLRRRSSEVIALIIPDIENPYFTALARGVEDRARDAGYSVMLCNSDEDLEKEADYLRIALTGQTAGVIIAHASAKSALGPLLAQGRAVVAVDRVPEGEQVDSVGVDNVEAGRLATRSLMDAGYRVIACIGGPEDVETARERTAGWRAEAGDRAGLLVVSDYRYEGGRRAMERLLAEGSADAVVATNNLMGAGAITALHDAGMHPMEFGVSVVGGLPFAPSWFEGVRVVDLPARVLGELAASTLLDRIAGADDPPRSVIVPIVAH